MTGSGIFVGRERELSGLRAALGGDTRLLLVTGDAGVGKTRFVAEGLAAAGRPAPAWGACLPLAEKLPLLPVAEVLDALGRLDGGARLDRALAPLRRTPGPRPRACCRGCSPPGPPRAAGPGSGSGSACSPGWPRCWRPRARPAWSW